MVRHDGAAAQSAPQQGAGPANNFTVAINSF